MNSTTVRCAIATFCYKSRYSKPRAVVSLLNKFYAAAAVHRAAIRGKIPLLFHGKCTFYLE